MTKQPDLSTVAGFSYRFVSLLAFWNHTESVAKQIAQLLLGESAMSLAITAEVGNRTLMEAIEVASHEMGDLGNHLRHFSKGYSTMLGYRNFYVHAYYGTMPSPANPEVVAGILFSQDGKGRVRYFNQPLTEDDLDLANAGIHSLISYGAAIQKELGADGDGLHGLMQVYGSSLEKPNWPPQIEKTPLYLQGQEPPPQEPKQKRGTPPKDLRP